MVTGFNNYNYVKDWKTCLKRFLSGPEPVNKKLSPESVHDIVVKLWEVFWIKW
jgi:hypothetical protein